MLRTQVYLPYSQVRALKQMASGEDVSFSEVLRRVIREELSKKAEKRSHGKKDVADRMLATARKIWKIGSGPKDLAQNLDKYLYGGKK